MKLFYLLLSLPLLAACTEYDDITANGGHSYDHIVFTAEIAPTAWTSGDSTRTDTDGTTRTAWKRCNNDLRDLGDGLIFTATDTPMTEEEDSIATRVGEIIHYNGTGGNVNQFIVSAQFTDDNTWYFENKTVTLTTQTEEGKRVWEIDNETYRWPGRDLRFLAFAPWTVNQGNTLAMNSLVTTSTPPYLSFNTTWSKNNDRHKNMEHDLSIAITAPHSVRQTPVPLTFQHTLAAIRVNFGPAAVAVTGSSDDCYIQSISLSGLQFEGQLYFNINNPSPNINAFSWSLGNATTTQTGYLDSEPNLEFTDLITYTTDEGRTGDVVFFVVPQTLASGTLTINYTQNGVAKSKAITLTNQTYRAGVITTYELNYFRSDFELDIQFDKATYNNADIGTPASLDYIQRGFTVFGCPEDYNSKLYEERELQYRYVIDWGKADASGKRYSYVYNDPYDENDMFSGEVISHIYKASDCGSGATATIKIMCVDRKLEKFNFNDNFLTGGSYGGMDGYPYQYMNFKLIAARNMTNVPIDDPEEMFRHCINLRSVSADLFGGGTDTGNFTRCFKNCNSLTTLPSNMFRGSKGTNYSYCFEGCTGLTSLPTNMFGGTTGTGATGNANFSYCFAGLNKLRTVQAYQFQGSNGYNFSHCFDGCTVLTALPSNMFAGTNGYDFTQCFNACAGITTLPNNLFVGNNEYDFSGCFQGCTGITTLPNSSVFTRGQIFTACFNGCTNLTSVANSFFPSTAKKFSMCFQNCRNLKTVCRVSSGSFCTSGDNEEYEINMYRYSVFAQCTQATDFSYCFAYCDKLTLDDYDDLYWYDDDENNPYPYHNYHYCCDALFYRNSNATTFQGCFCSSGIKRCESIFGQNTKATNFQGCFTHAGDLIVDDNMFFERQEWHVADNSDYPDGSTEPRIVGNFTTRFSSVTKSTLDFSAMFENVGWKHGEKSSYATSAYAFWGGSIGSLPKLWTVSGLTTAHVKGCFYGVPLTISNINIVGGYASSNHTSSFYSQSWFQRPTASTNGRWVNDQTQGSYTATSLTDVVSNRNFYHVPSSF